MRIGQNISSGAPVFVALTLVAAGCSPGGEKRALTRVIRTDLHINNVD